jgi:hypothetical protein
VHENQMTQDKNLEQKLQTYIVPLHRRKLERFLGSVTEEELQFHFTNDFCFNKRDKENCKKMSDWYIKLADHNKKTSFYNHKSFIQNLCNQYIRSVIGNAESRLWSWYYFAVLPFPLYNKMNAIWKDYFDKYLTKIYTILFLNPKLEKYIRN